MQLVCKLVVVAYLETETILLPIWLLLNENAWRIPRSTLGSTQGTSLCVARLLLYISNPQERLIEIFCLLLFLCNIAIATYLMPEFFYKSRYIIYIV